MGSVGVGGSKKRESKSQLSRGFGVAVELAVFAGPVARRNGAGQEDKEVKKRLVEKSVRGVALFPSANCRRAQARRGSVCETRPRAADARSG